MKLDDPDFAGWLDASDFAWLYTTGAIAIALGTATVALTVRNFW